MIRYTELKNTNRHNLRDVIPLSKPFTVLVEPCSLCNFRCVQCFQSLTGDNYFTQTRQMMHLSLFKKIIEQLKNWPGDRIKVLKLSLYGEPLLHPDFPEMLKIAKEADIAERIETTTNASLLTENIARAMVDNQLDYVRVSIYSPFEERNREITNSPISAAVIHDNLARLQKIKKMHNSQRPFVSPKMLESTPEENSAFMDMYSDVGDELYLDKPHGWIKIDKESNFLEKLYKERAEEEKVNIEAQSSTRIACPMAFTTMAVRSNGDVAPCCVDFIGGTNLGNVRKNTLQEIWNSQQWLDFQIMQLADRKHENFSCARCDIYKSDHYTRDNIDGFPVEKLLSAAERK